MQIRAVNCVIAALCIFAPGARGAVDLHYEGGYTFCVTDTEYGFTVHGREVTPEGQNVYVEFHFYAVHSACPEETNSLCRDNLFLLENEKGVAYEPTSVHIMLNQALFETSRPYVKYKYEGDFAGPCALVVKLSGGERVRLDMGPAEYDFYRMGVVTARDGLELHMTPNYGSTVLKKLRRGDTFYLTGREEYFWPYPDLAWYDCVSFEEAICGDARGWLATYDNLKRMEYMDQHGDEPPDEICDFAETGGFAPRYVRSGRAGTDYAEKEGAYEK